MVWIQNETAVVCERKDKRDVLKISNKSKARLVRVTNRRGKEKIKPNIVADYNLEMSGVDRSHQIFCYYQGLRKTVGIKKLASLYEKCICIMLFICLNVISHKAVRF